MKYFHLDDFDYTAKEIQVEEATSDSDSECEASSVYSPASKKDVVRVSVKTDQATETKIQHRTTVSSEKRNILVK
eukprot:m.935 g.935  ORF g.935 m.935 type:complete len:75 (+) comp5213_c0_seq1:128-352(+)